MYRIKITRTFGCRSRVLYKRCSWLRSFIRILCILLNMPEVVKFLNSSQLAALKSFGPDNTLDTWPTKASIISRKRTRPLDYYIGMPIQRGRQRFNEIFIKTILLHERKYSEHAFTSNTKICTRKINCNVSYILMHNRFPNVFFKSHFKGTIFMAFFF